MYKHLFFDFDGTLFNTYPRMINALIKMFKDKRKETHTYDELFKECMVTFKHVGEKYNITDEEWEYYTNLVDTDFSLPEFEPYPGVKQLLQLLNFKGINCYLYTNRDDTSVMLLKKWGLDKYFKDFILSSVKPEPTPIDEFVLKHNIKKEECLIVGDRKLDIECGINTHIDTFSYNDYKAEDHATYQSQSFKDLLKIVFLDKVQGVIFDLDGVLLGSDRLHAFAWQKVANEEGFNFDEEVNDLLRGISRKEALEVILKYNNLEMTDERKAKILTKKGYYYRELIEEIDDTFIPQETLSIIKELKNMGLKLGVASSSFNARYLLNKLGLLNHFDVVVDGTLVTNVKPDPELFIKCASLMSLREKDLVVVEDAPSGIDAGNEGGFITIGIGYATKYNKTNVKINSILELKDVINKLNSLVK